MSTSLKLYHTESGALEVGIDETGRGCEYEDAIVLTNNGWKQYHEIDTNNDLVLYYTSQHTIVWQSIDKVLSWSID